MDKKLIVNKKPLKGEDGYKVFSVRIKDDTVERLDRLSAETHRSRNELIGLILEFALDNCVVSK